MTEITKSQWTTLKFQTAVSLMVAEINRPHQDAPDPICEWAAELAEDLMRECGFEMKGGDGQ